MAPTQLTHELFQSDSRPELKLLIIAASRSSTLVHSRSRCPPAALPPPDAAALRYRQHAAPRPPHHARTARPPPFLSARASPPSSLPPSSSTSLLSSPLNRTHRQLPGAVLYRDPFFRFVNPHHFFMPGLLLEYRRAFTRGVVLGALTHSNPQFPVPPQLREALRLPGDLAPSSPRPLRPSLNPARRLPRRAPLITAHALRTITATLDRLDQTTPVRHRSGGRHLGRVARVPRARARARGRAMIRDAVHEALIRPRTQER
ncbi:hypothetical protein C8J57DRAFT_1601734 [Mycena rebaudengoi]|nr:hypothetical protein C8J57DRAFT_1601734 [Mycena rebaudengoi]